MIMPAPDHNTRAHLEWLGFIQPNGLVVSAPALVKAGALLNRHDAEGQSRLAGCISERALDQRRGPEPCIRDFREFATSVLGWGFSSQGYAGTDDAPIPPELEVLLPDYGETLRPDFAVRERDPRNGASPWQLLVQVLDAGRDFDVPATGDGTGSRLEASPQGRAERLLRGTGVPAGLLFNGTALRLISAPRGESSGWMDFRVADMSRTAGRPLCSALRLLLSEQRLLALPRGQRLAALLEDSRKYQNEVSERLSEQVMHALYELLRGLQAAHDASGGALLREPLSPEGDRNDIYRGLLSVILRLVFLLYAEERGMLPENETFVRHYSLAGLYQRLREDAALHPDTMDQRFGAWAQLLVLFRLIHDGARDYRTGGAVSLPERQGALFDPDRFPFLEGRRAGAGAGARQRIERVRPPLISDGAVYRVLEKLLVLDGERISYRTLDVEQIGSVYETIMGFRMEIATGWSPSSPRRSSVRAHADQRWLHGTNGGRPARGARPRAGQGRDSSAITKVCARATLSPVRLRANAGKSFQGSIVLGMGFTFDDTDKKGVASPLAEMQRLIEADPRNREVIYPYIGGEEVNTSPTHAHHRYVINFRDWPLRRADRQAQASKTWTPGSADILSARTGGPLWTTRRRPEIAPAGTMPALPEQTPLLGRATDSESRPTSPETGREAMRTPANRDRDDEARDERGSGDDVPVEMASWAGATDAERREWLRSGVVPGDYPGPVAADWPGLLAIVEERVKPERSAQQDVGGKKVWWQFLRPRPELHIAISGLDRVLVISRHGQNAAFAFLPSGAVYSDATIVFPFSTCAAVCALQSRPHEIWARFFGSSMKDDLRYTPSDCFETFPFPDGWDIHPSLEAAGKAYHEHRAALMVRNDQGMTKTYNRFHDPYENDSDISQLRELHAAMDRAVLDAYGWTDIPTDCDYLLDYEIDEATWGRKKRPYRYRWPDPVRDEVLARLLALNAERAAEEARLGATTDTSRGASTLSPAQPQYRRASDSRTARNQPQSSNHSDLPPVAETAAKMAMNAVSSTDQSPLLVKRFSRPVPSEIYPVLWKFAFERHRIYLRRLSGEVYPWTKDRVLTEYKFTNAFRAADRVSQYLIELVYSDPDASEDTLFLRTLLFKIFNKIDTWKRIVGILGMPVASEFDYEACGSLLEKYRRERISIYSGAYIMPSGGHSGAPKHRMHLHLIRRMLDDNLPGRLGATESLAEAYDLLLAYPTLGPFLAFQYAVDLNYTTLMNHSERDFVVAGPGALDGLSKCFKSLGDYSPEDTIVWLSDMQMEEFSRYNLDFDGLWGRPLQPIDVQNLLCEVSKYTRATHPDVKGRSGRKRIKQKFRMTGPLPKPLFPPRWGLKQRVAAWLGSTRGEDTEPVQTLRLASHAPTPTPGSGVPD